MSRSSAYSRRAGRLLAVLAAVALVAAACGDDSTSGSDATTTTADAATSTTTTLPTTTAPIPEGAVALEALQLNIVEFGEAGFVEIINTGSESIPLAGVNICEWPDYADLGDVVDIESLEPGATVQVSADVLGGIDAADGEAALYDGSDFGSPDAMLSYVQWGSGDHQRATVAVAAGLWPSAADFVTPDEAVNSIESGGFAADPEGWS